MEPFNYVCTHLERVDELLAFIALLLFTLVVELFFLALYSRRSAVIASQRLDLERRRLNNLGAQPLDTGNLNEARNPPQQYNIRTGTGNGNGNGGGSGSSGDKDKSKKKA